MYQNKAWKNETGFELDFTGKPLEKSVSENKGNRMKNKFRKGQQIVFDAIDNFTGELVRRKGFFVSDGASYIKKHPELMSEYGSLLPGEAYIIREGIMERGRLNLVTDDDIIEAI